MGPEAKYFPFCFSVSVCMWTTGFVFTSPEHGCTLLAGFSNPTLSEQMNLMLGDIPRLLDLIWSWISPSEDDRNVFR